MAGLTSEGLVIKRLEEVVNDRISSARNQFGNDAGTSVNDVLGRLLRVHAGSEADVWELAEAVYNSFNPAFATGSALDRVVAYAGLIRYEASPSKATLLVSGDYLTSIPASSSVLSSATVFRFSTVNSVFFDTSLVSGFRVQPIVAQEAEYSLSIGLDVYSYFGQVGDTLEIISQNLLEQVNRSQNFQATLLDDGILEVSFNDPFVSRNTSASTNLTYRKISKVVQSESTQAGDIGQPEDTLDIIGTPILGWDSVTNPTAATIGRLRETDEELRLRFRDTKELNAKGTIDAIFSNLSNIVGVTDVQVYENSTSALDINSLPPKSFSAVIQGGNSLEIAQVLWETKPAGIQAFGNTSVVISDSQGLPHTVDFSRPIFVDLYIDLVISPEEFGTVAADTDVQIVDAISKYIKNTYSVGDDITYSRLYTPINSIPGFQVDSLTIGTDPAALGVSNVQVGFDGIADVKQQNVTITVNQ
jgi:uncharacterized phage protein gp47/JayE